MEHFDVVIVGAGAAGLMCAMAAGQRGRRVLLLDHAPEAGRKILISGGGRCNFTNIDCAADRFWSENPHFARSALARYTPRDFIALLDRHGIAYHEKTLGQLFCDGPARAVVEMLLAECAAAGVTLRLGQTIGAVSGGEGFRLETSGGDVCAPALVLASGGLSIPKLGATGFAHRIARQFGLSIVPPRPALVPLTFEGEPLALMQPLAGVALPVVATAGAGRFAEAMLFTHRGLSGPAILQISSAWVAGAPITLDLLPGQDATAWLHGRKQDRGRAELKTVLGEALPQRLAQSLAAPFLAQNIATLPDRALGGLGGMLNRWQITPSGTEGYAKAEVTAGGIATADLSQRTLEAIRVPGLFVIGEAVDMTGWLGGYNFQWAWSSGWCAGQAV